MAFLAPIPNKSLREHVLDALRDAILNGELKPGQTLVESDLATQLGVSRAPLREAIQILKTEGLLEAVSYKGTTVKHLEKKEAAIRHYGKEKHDLKARMLLIL